MKGEMKLASVMQIEPLGLTEPDLVVVRAACVAAKRQVDPGLLRYWSRERRLLWLAIVAAGEVRTWMVVPCSDEGEVVRLSDMWSEFVANAVAGGYDEAQDIIRRAAS